MKLVKVIIHFFNFIFCAAKSCYSHWLKSTLPIFLGICDISQRCIRTIHGLSKRRDQLYCYAFLITPVHTAQDLELFCSTIYFTGRLQAEGLILVALPFISPDGTGGQILDNFINGWPLSLIPVWTSVIDDPSIGYYILFNPALLGTQPNDSGEWGDGGIFKSRFRKQ